MFNKEEVISPILCGGFGNNLFQIAATIQYSYEMDYPFVIGYWTSYNSKTKLPPNHGSSAAGDFNPYFQPWGGWPGTNYRDFTWSNMFPRLPYFKNPDNTIDGAYNATNVDDKYAYGTDPTLPGQYIAIDCKLGQQIQGYFFNKRYWHKARYEVLKYLGFSQSYLYESLSRLPHFLRSMNTVSLNFRLPDSDYAGDVELSENLKKDLEGLDWIRKAINYFPKDILIVVTSNNAEKAKKLLKSEFPDSSFFFIVGSPGFQMAVSSSCNHHILTSSTFSFWCCYLDPKQPMGHTVYSENFIERHSEHLIPYLQWYLIQK